MKKKLALLLSLTMVAPAFVPFVQSNVYAEGQTAYVESQDSELDELKNSEVKLESLKNDVEGTEYEEAVDKGLETINKLESDLTLNTAARFSPETIYDVDSIGFRIEAMTEAIDAMIFSTQELNNKVEKAHVELGFAITKLVIRIADPFSSNDRILDQINEVKEVMNRVSTYPDLQATDKATLYYKSKLDKAIWETRFERDKKVLGVKDFETYNNLNKVITKAVGVQLNPRTTVEEVDNAIIMLDEALEFAINK
ncbi:MAG: CAMP factor family pore-forming toxin [Peptoniphilaceae bacterium]